MAAVRAFAFDASTGKQRWRYESGKPMIGAVTATSGDVLFTGEMTNDFLALDAKTGQVLYHYNVGAPIAGGVVTYRVKDKQYVAVVSGFVGAYNMMAPEIGGGTPTVTVFALKE